MFTECLIFSLIWIYHYTLCNRTSKIYGPLAIFHIHLMDGSSHHCKPHISFLQSRPVICAVTGDCNHLPLFHNGAVYDTWTQGTHEINIKILIIEIKASVHHHQQQDKHSISPQVSFNVIMSLLYCTAYDYEIVIRGVIIFRRTRDERNWGRDSPLTSVCLSVGEERARTLSLGQILSMRSCSICKTFVNKNEIYTF